VRQSLSAIKGGRLAAAAAPARMVTYIISDVPGDDPRMVGSGPTIAAAIDPEATLSILRSYGISVLPRLAEAIERNVIAPVDVPKGTVHVLATPMQALEAAAAEARRLGFSPLILGDAIEGEAREVATVMAGISRSVLAYGHPLGRPSVLLSGGETTVTVRGDGRGGRNAEFLLSLAWHLRTLPGVAAIACDTDGIDGSEDNAGAWMESGLDEAGARQAATRLANNDAYTYFSDCDRLVVTGPTGTNVNDFRAIVIR
jgi:hydroxypyruvate reductase